MLCALTLYVNGEIYSFLRQIYLLSEFLPEICWDEVEIFSYFGLDIWPGVSIHALGLISQHTTY